MTGGALALLLFAALSHAAWNLAAGRSRGDSTVFVWLYMTGSAILAAPVALIRLADQGWPLSWTLLTAPILTALLHVVYSLVLQAGYARADTGVVYPVARGVGPLITMIIAIVFLGERPSVTAVAGGVVVILGIVVVTGRALRPGRPDLAVGLRYGVATGAAIASYTLWDSHSVSGLNLDPIAFFGLSVIMQSLILLPSALVRRDRILPTLRRSWASASSVAVLSPAAYIMVLFAMQSTPVSLVAPVRESSIIIGSLAGWLIFKEPDPVRRVTGAVIVLAGITLIALS